MLTFFGGAAIYAALTIGAIIYGNNVGGVVQIQLLLNVVVTFGMLSYLKTYDYKVNFSAKLYDNKCLYITSLLIALLTLGNFHPMTQNADIVPNVWLFVTAIFVALGEELYFRACGDFFIKENGVAKELAMIGGYALFYLYRFCYGTQEGVFAFLISLGTGTLLTALYLRYRKLGANAAIHFVMYYLVNVTQVNQASDETIFGNTSWLALILAAAGMAFYGAKLLKQYNESGIMSEEALLKRRRENPTEFEKAFDDSKAKQEGKIMTKAEPKLEKNKAKYVAKQKQKAAKHNAKLAAKKAKEDAKLALKDEKKNR